MEKSKEGNRPEAEGMPDGDFEHIPPEVEELLQDTEEEAANSSKRKRRKRRRTRGNS